MRRIITAHFMTIDGVIQSSPEDGFKYEGWFFGYVDEETNAVIQERLKKPVDLLLGRKTFDIWEPQLPEHSDFWQHVMTATKYVASNTRGKRLAADGIPRWRPCRESPRAEENRRSGSLCNE